MINKPAIYQRNKVIRLIRDFFERQKFLELQCPLLWPSLPYEPTNDYFQTIWQVGNKKQPLFLIASPEKAMKWQMAADLGPVFTIEHSFRNLEGKSSTHHPEFLMLEWYRDNCDYRKIIADTYQLFDFIQQQLKLTTYHFNQQLVISIEDLWQKQFNVSLANLQTEQQLFEFAREHGYQIDSNDNWEKVYDQIFLNEIEPKDQKGPLVLIDFPARTSPLCRARSDRSWLAERFEFYLDGIEVGNGNSEPLEISKLQAYFKETDAMPVDTVYLQATAKMAATGKQFAGVGIGVDRLTMLLGKIDSLDELWPELDE